MSSESLWLLCLGLCLGRADQGSNETLPRPSLCAWPSSLVEVGSSVILLCRAGFQNATFVLRKLLDPGFKRERSSAETKAEFPLAGLRPEDAGGYSCAYKTAAARQWSEPSRHLQLVVTGSLPAPSLLVSTDPEVAPGHRTLRCLIPNNGTECIVTALLKTGIPDPLQVKEGRENQMDFTLRNVTSKDGGKYSCVYYQCHWPHLGSARSGSLEMQVTDESDGPGARATKTGPGNILVATFSGLAIVSLFFCVFLVIWCTGQDSPGGDSTQSSHSTFPKQETSADFSHLGKTAVPEVTCVEPSAEDIPSEVASVPADVTPGSQEGAVREV
ncbi:V-set and transmembrane domain-containing protein 1 isoform X2 [Sciurus carolinensis]|uniref:V-set and transmembrane domain-containing protein 1 isoform X2 n=1 Tax=Sciurus carolinensis TaxID=30640 RepID=UPI001FB32F4B|nr:V-set and transmembrane domain-containing protein 1 isoform X2 [Sciurus carolinensis]